MGSICLSESGVFHLRVSGRGAGEGDGKYVKKQGGVRFGERKGAARGGGGRRGSGEIRTKTKIMLYMYLDVTMKLLSLYAN